MAVTSRRVGWAMALLLGAALGCAGGARAEGDKKAEGEKAALPRAAEGVLLSQKDDGAKVTLRHGEWLAVGLEFASGTAFTWKVKDDCKKHLTLRQHAIFRPASAPPGSPRYSVYAYQAARIGKCDLSYQLGAPPGALGKHVTYHLTILPKVARE